MSNLLQSQKKLLFGWYYAWLKLSDIREQQQDINTGMQQPDTIKVSRDQPPAREFKKKIEVRLDTTSVDHAQRLHNLFGKCLQGAAATKWTAILDQFPVATCTNITFKEAQKDYLEKIAEVSNLEVCLYANSTTMASLHI
eukprot:5854855-Ditylum_brightwellii.AAC.2